MNFTNQWLLLVELNASVVSVRMAHGLGVRDYRLRITDCLSKCRNPFFFTCKTHCIRLLLLEFRFDCR